eukprot:gb/GEZN01003225.1/.p1 GENE.gb/GEZN01003225.1/~~gb/GEZN01003225.1/.p1  ORF type:complete len:634 (+),score=65.77 gb/GEZN01003225.1/:28-1902(+)
MIQTVFLVSDIFIALAYFSIPLVIVIYLQTYADRQYVVHYLPVIILFATFVLFCGVGHAARAALTMEHTDFRLRAAVVVNVLTAIVSIMAALYVLFFLPRLLNAFTALRNSVDQVEQDKAKANSAFMAFLCHEIRNPLFVITSSVENILDSPLPHSLKCDFEAIGLSSEYILRLVNDVLDLTKFDLGEVSLEAAEFDLMNLLHQVSACWDPKARKKDIAFQLEINRKVPRMVVGDSMRLSQVLHNLVGNAVKFTQKGYVRVSVEVVDDFVCSDNDILSESADSIVTVVKVGSSEHERESLVGSQCNVQTLKFTVSDTGMGIPEASIPNLFKAYSQATSSISRQYGGTGLGLAIVRSICSAMGSHIECKSTEGKGTEFCFCLNMPVCKDRPPSYDQDFSAAKSTLMPPLASIQGDSDFDMEGIVRVYIKDTSPRGTPMVKDRKVVSSSTSTSSGSSISAASSPTSSNSSATLDYSNCSFLVVDDMAINRKIIRRLLSKLRPGSTITECENGQVAVDVVNARGSTEPFTAIFMDIQMPVMDGVEAARKMREDIKYTGKILALSAGTMEDKQVSVHMDKFLSKPISRKVMGRVLDSLQEQDKLRPGSVALSPLLHRPRQSIQNLGVD